MKLLIKYGFMEKRLNKYSGSVLEGNDVYYKYHFPFENIAINH